MSPAAKFDEEYFTRAYGDYSAHNPRRKLAFYRNLLTRYLPPLPSPRVLDLGCAFGLFLAELPPEFRKFGVDASYYAISAAASRSRDVHFIAGDCGDPPIVSTFDAIVAFDVLEDIPAVDATLDFVRRSLAEDGLFLFVVPVYDGPLGPAIRWLDHDPTHVHKRSRDWWRDQAGRRFEIIFWTGILRYLIAPHVYLHVSGVSTRRVAPAIAVIAKPK